MSSEVKIRQVIIKVLKHIIFYKTKLIKTIILPEFKNYLNFIKE